MVVNALNLDDEATPLSKFSNELKLCRGNNGDIKLNTEFELSVDSGSLINLEGLMLIVKFEI